MYAAAWYREPTDQELAGYLSTAQGPGWGLITCKTVADFRVEDCVGLDEYPEGSQILRAVLAAAWQFRVRPPRVGGVSQVGDWVRIRIDYDREARNPLRQRFVPLTEVGGNLRVTAQSTPWDRGGSFSAAHALVKAVLRRWFR